MINKGMIPFSDSEAREQGNLMPPVRLPDQGIYQRYGADAISDLVLEVYKELAVSRIHGMFPEDPLELEKSARKSALFWITACGGPRLYEETYGPPRMKARHQKFPIGRSERDDWVACWNLVLDRNSHGFSKEETDSLRNYIKDFSLWMVNR